MGFQGVDRGDRGGRQGELVELRAASLQPIWQCFNMLTTGTVIQVCSTCVALAFI